VLRAGAAVLIAVLVLGGCALFLFESQTFGGIALVLGVFWAGVRYLAQTGETLEGAIKRRRGVLIVTGLLILVVLGALPLLLVTIGVKSDPLASPMDGPPFGDTGPT
jgi:hypothetical protein